MSQYFIIRVCNFIEGLYEVCCIGLFIAVVALWAAVGAKLL